MVELKKKIGDVDLIDKIDWNLKVLKEILYLLEIASTDDEVANGRVRVSLGTTLSEMQDRVDDTKQMVDKLWARLSQVKGYGKNQKAA